MKKCINSGKTNILSMSIIKYNANSGGHSVGDCVCRAISIAFNADYNEIRRYLNKYKKELNASTYKQDKVFSKVIEELGGSEAMDTDISISGTTVEEFVDSHNDDNAYIMEVGKPGGRPSHLVTCRSGNLFDSWDCSQWNVHHYYKVPSSCFGKELELSGIKDYLEQFARNEIQDSIQLYLNWVEDKWFNKYDNNAFTIDETSAYIKDYSVEINLCFQFQLSDGKVKSWTFKVVYPFTPYMSYDEGIEFIQKKTKERLYEKFYAIHKYIDDYETEYQKAKESDEELPDTSYYGRYDAPEDKFLESLPAWVQIRCKHIYIMQSKGRGERYNDNYELICSPLPGDENKSDVEFYGATADIVREEIDRYKKDFSRAGDDYDVDYDGIWDY